MRIVNLVTLHLLLAVPDSAGDTTLHFLFPVPDCTGDTTLHFLFPVPDSAGDTIDLMNCGQRELRIKFPQRCLVYLAFAV